MSVATAALGDVCETLSGFAWGAAKFNQEQRGVRIIRIQNVDNGANDFVYWDQPYDQRFIIRNGDLLLTLSGSFRIASWNRGEALLNQRIVKLTPSEKLDREWLLYVLRERLGEIERLGKHALVNNVSLSDLRKMQIPLPPLAEQRRIARILDAADAARAKRRAALAKLDLLPQAIFLELFGDPIKNPKEWPTSALLDVCSPKQWPTISGSQLTTSGFPVFGANGHIGFYSSYNHEEPTVLITCRGATCGTINVSPPKCYVTGNAMALDNPDEKRISIAYLEWVLRLRGVHKAISGTAQPQITRQNLHSISLPLPPLELQREFARRVAAVEKLKAAQRASLAKLDALFASLQHRAFRGELFAIQAE